MGEKLKKARMLENGDVEILPDGVEGENGGER